MNWKRSLIAAVAAVPVILLFAWGFTRDPGQIPSPLPGHPAPQFSLDVFAPGQSPLSRPVGDTVRLADLRGQVVVLNFWASWCGACREEHAVLSAAARLYAGRPVHFLGVLYNDSVAAGEAWIAEMGGQSYPSMQDRGARTAIDYGLYGVPETFFIDGGGRVAYKQLGPVTEVSLAHIVDSLIAALPRSWRPRNEEWIVKRNTLLLSAAMLAAITGRAGAQAGGASVAPVAQQAVADTALEARTNAVAAQLRCPVCQGVSIQDSPAELAQQMRNLVRDQLRTGKSPDEVKAYFVSKYGEWILLQPRASGFNILIYALPVLAVVGGLAVIVVAMRRWTKPPENLST